MRIGHHISALIVTCVLSGATFSGVSAAENDYKALIDRGEFTGAEAAIGNLLARDTTLTPQERLDLSFEIERMHRIRKDFTRTEADVLDYIRQYIPDVTRKDLEKWEREKSLECMIIDGEKRYFKWAARNLFRINKECRGIWDRYHGRGEAEKPAAEEFDLDEHDKQIIDHCTATGKYHALPVRFRIEYSISVNPDAVPEGEIIRCWIPFPRQIPNRQTEISLIRTDPPFHVLTPNDLTLQRTIYLERPAKSGAKTDFLVEYEYTSHGVYVDVNPDSVRPVDPTSELRLFLQDRPPHIVFTDELRQLSQRIVGNETSPYRVARRLFEWIDTNIPWASAREYSTIRNLGSYAVENGHGDCGIQAMLLITLCRMNGIPARWQSGWEFQPPDDTMHDWSMIYFEPYGWVPADVTYGLRKTRDDRLKWFYLSGMDSYRLIFNDDFSQPLYPAKIYPRSETIDSQRGEVEWRGGNIYFDRWDWALQWQVLDEQE